jgi:hypothetical protein
MKEIWKDIPWYEWLYQASNLWLIKSLNFRNTWKSWIRKKCNDKDWYEHVILSKLWIHKTKKVHRLMLETFIWLSDMECNHKNHIRNDNKLNNLEYISRIENIEHSRLLRKVIQFDLNGNLIRLWNSASEAARSIWAASTNISRACRGWINSCSWFKWKYL